MIKTTGIDHITLTVANVAKSKEFYTKVCGLKVIADYSEVCGLTDGTFQLWVAASEKSVAKDAFNPDHLGLHHWAFKVTSMDAFKEIEAHLKKLNISMEDNGITDDGYGGTGIFTSDPDGMKVEFHLRE